MDTNQARLLLHKIQHLFETIDTPAGALSRIERDLLMDYTRQFYASLTAEEASVKTAPPVEEKRTPVPPPAPEPPAVDETPPPREPAPAPAPEPKPEPQIVKMPVVEPVTVEETVPLHTDTPVRSAASTNGNGHRDTSALFLHHEARDLSDKLRLSPIEDLSRAMGINERFLTINELFGGEHEAFDRTLRTLNSLPTFAEARHFLENEIIPRYGWMDDKKLKKAQVFIQLVQRRFI